MSGHGSIYAISVIFMGPASGSCADSSFTGWTFSSLSCASSPLPSAPDCLRNYSRLWGFNRLIIADFSNMVVSKWCNPDEF